VIDKEREPRNFDRGRGDRVKTGAEIVPIDADHPEEAFAKCREVIKAGGVVVYPTDTFYGLGADPRNAAAVRRLYDIKGRPEGQPILLLISKADEVRNWAAAVSFHAEELIRKHWPGPLTLIFDARRDVIPELTAGTGTIGLRVPGSAPARQLLAFLGAALTGTSANISGVQSPRTAEEAAFALGDRVDLILDGGAASGLEPSTIVDVRKEPFRLIRQGAVKLNLS